jgi:hypothetical protein
MVSPEQRVNAESASRHGPANAGYLLWPLVFKAVTMLSYETRNNYEKVLMPRHPLSSKGPRKPKRKRESGNARSELAIVLILAGFTAAVVVVIALAAIFGSRASAGGLAPEDRGVLTSGSETSVVSDSDSRYGGMRAVMGGIEDARGDKSEVA